MSLIEQSNAFWAHFCRMPLYECGFGDTIGNCGARTARTREELILACAYIKGAADIVRSVRAGTHGFMTPAYCIADTVSRAAGMILAWSSQPESLYNNEQVAAVMRTWLNEILDDTRKYTGRDLGELG